MGYPPDPKAARKTESLVAVLQDPVTPHPPVLPLTFASARPPGQRSKHWTAELILAVLSHDCGPDWLASMQPADVLSLALVHPVFSRWVRALLRSQTMEPIFQRFYARIFRPSAVLHPELLPPRTELLALLQRPGGHVSKTHLHMQHLAEVWCHFCNVHVRGCQWHGWARLGFHPYLAPDGSWPDRADGHAWTLQSVVESIEDYIEYQHITTEQPVLRSALVGTTLWLRCLPDYSDADGSLPNGTATEKLRWLLCQYAALFPQRSDEAAAEDMRLRADDFASDAQYIAAVSTFRFEITVDARGQLA